MEQLLPRERDVNSHKDYCLLPFIADVTFKLHPSVAPLSSPSCTHPHIIGSAWHLVPSTAAGSPRAMGIRELRAHRHFFSSQGQTIYTQIFLKCLPNVPLKAVSIAIFFPCCRLRHLFCPQQTGNTVYPFHSKFACMPWLLKGSAILSHCFPVDAFSETQPYSME